MNFSSVLYQLPLTLVCAILLLKFTLLTLVITHHCEVEISGASVGEFTECAFGFWGIKGIGFGSVGCLRNLRAHYVETLC
jgi:hypothetical protein